MNREKNKNILIFLSFCIFSLFLFSCTKEESEQQSTALPVTPKQYKNHGIDFEYPGTWKVYSDMETGFDDITVILATPSETSVVIKLFPKEKAGDFDQSVKTYDAQYEIPVFSEPKPQYIWTEVTRAQHKGKRKINEIDNPTVKPFVKEYYHFQLGEQTALVVMESNKKEIDTYINDIAVILNSIKTTS